MDNLSHLDPKDFQILFELDENSRQSINELSKKTKLSRDVVAYRMKQLEKRGVIQNYISIIDFSKFVRYTIRLYLKLQNMTPNIEEEIVHFFIKQKNTLTVYKIDGVYDLAVGYLADDLRQYQQMYFDFLSLFRRFVAENKVSIFLDYIHYPRSYLTGVKRRDLTAVSTGSFTSFSYDETDLKLLNLLKENSRLSLLELGKKLSMTATGVKYKLRNLEKNKVIVAYKILLNTAMLGYHYYKVDLELEDISVLSRLIHFLDQHPNVIYRDVTVGGSDLEFDCEFKKDADLYHFIDELKEAASGKIRRCSYYRALKIYKYSYFPEELLHKAVER